MARKPGKAAPHGASSQKAGTLSGLRPELFGAYKRMLAYQFVGAAGLVAVFIVGMFVCFYTKFDPPLYALLVMCGMMGAFFSALTRLYNVDDISVALISPTVSRLGGTYLLMYSFVPMIVGAVASVVLYMVFVADLVTGGLFPTLQCKGADSCTALKDLLTSYAPAEAKDYGKALIWAFVAGFSERLVPDTLQTLVAKQQKQDNKP